LSASPIAIEPEQSSERRRRICVVPILLVSCLAALVFSPSAQAAGAPLGWGENLDGQLGNGTFTEMGCVCIPNPTAAVGIDDATQVAGGDEHTLALRAGGTVMAWGANGAGQLGNGTTSSSPKPLAVPGPANVVAVDAGTEHSLALLANGTVMAWGDNTSGQLGLGGTSGPESCESDPCSRVPVPVPGLSEVIAISAGGYFSLALLANGTVMAWGYDNFGQLGSGAGTSGGCGCVDHPVAVSGLSGVVAISAGDSHSLALLIDGRVAAWGENSYGQLGTGSPTTAPPNCYCLPPTVVDGLAGVRAVSAGGYTSMALLGDGSARAWGENFYGQIGNGETTKGGCQCIPTPTTVSGLAGAQDIAAGFYHGLALDPNGAAMGWGWNEYGQVGDGTMALRSAPVQVSGLSGAGDLSAGDLTSFALTGPAQTLTVAFAGAGAGAVGGTDGIVCPAVNCASRIPQGRVAILRAEPAPGSGFAGFTGPCTGTAPCQARMDGDQTVIATFGPPKGTKITKAKIKQGKKRKKGKKGKKARTSREQLARRRAKPRARATFFFSAPGAVTGYQCMLVKPKPKRKGKKRKRAKPRFSSCASPRRYKKLGKGRYTFRVRALNILGTDAQPAVRKFRIRR
jgi:alpha-tubulin suppressor-like RCC1 family protein